MNTELQKEIAEYEQKLVELKASLTQAKVNLNKQTEEVRNMIRLYNKKIKLSRLALNGNKKDPEAVDATTNGVVSENQL